MAVWPVTSAIVAMVANRPVSAYSVRSMNGPARKAGSSPAPDRSGHVVAQPYGTSRRLRVRLQHADSHLHAVFEAQLLVEAARVDVLHRDVQERAPPARTDVVDERAYDRGRESSSLMLRGGASGADLGPVPRMHTLTGYADELAVYTPAAVASQVDGRPGEAALAREAVTDPEQTVRFDVELLRSAAVLPDTITVSGHVYDVTTGLVTTIVPAAPMHPRMSSLTPKSAGAPSL